MVLPESLRESGGSRGCSSETRPFPVWVALPWAAPVRPELHVRAAGPPRALVGGQTTVMWAQELGGGHKPLVWPAAQSVPASLPRMASGAIERLVPGRRSGWTGECRWWEGTRVQGCPPAPRAPGTGSASPVLPLCWALGWGLHVHTALRASGHADAMSG